MGFRGGYRILKKACYGYQYAFARMRPMFPLNYEDWGSTPGSAPGVSKERQGLSKVSGPNEL